MSVRGAAILRVTIAVVLVLFVSWHASAQPAAKLDSESVHELTVHGETHADLFRRALLPGPNGALVSTQTLLPARQFVLVRARELGDAEQRGKLELELAGWSAIWLGEIAPERRVDGDLQTLNVGYRRGPFSLRLGRQHVAGGAARYSRFDGAEVELELSGFELAAYGGFSVLPRWDRRPGYHYLGAAIEADLRDPEALREPDRLSGWLGGARAGFSRGLTSAHASFHEQRAERGLVRRNLGVDLRSELPGRVGLGATGFFELDSRQLADARVFGEWSPRRELDVSLEYEHVQPALLLPRDSVLSVFGSDGYDQTSARLGLHPARSLSFVGAGSLQLYASGTPGARGEITARISPAGRAVVRVTYARVLTADNGYHSVRASLSGALLDALFGTLDSHAFLYDQAIAGRASSTVYAGTLTYRRSSAFSGLVGASLAQSPYARFDAQARVALSYDFDFSTWRADP
jgi:hypothetical protein